MSWTIEVFTRDQVRYQTRVRHTTRRIETTIEADAGTVEQAEQAGIDWVARWEQSDALAPSYQEVPETVVSETSLTPEQVAAAVSALEGGA